MDAAPCNAVLKTLPQLPSTTTNTPILRNTMRLGRGGTHLSLGSPEPGSKPGAQHCVSAPLLASPKASSPHLIPPLNQKAADPTGGRRVRPDLLSEWSSLSLSCKHLAQGCGHSQPAKAWRVRPHGPHPAPAARRALPSLIGAHSVCGGRWRNALTVSPTGLSPDAPECLDVCSFAAPFWPAGQAGSGN